NGAIVASTFIGGAGFTTGQGIAVDGQNQAFVTGWTTAKNPFLVLPKNFPTTQGAFQEWQNFVQPPSSSDGFVAVLDTSNSQIKLLVRKSAKNIPGNKGFVALGDAFDYEVTVINKGPMAAKVTLSDKLPAGLTLQGNPFWSSAPKAVTCTPSLPIVSCDLGTMQAGDAVVVTLHVKAETVQPTQNQLVNCAAVTAK